MAYERKTEATWIAAENRWCCRIQVNGERKKFYSSVKGKKGKIQAEKKADEWLAGNRTDGNVKVSQLWSDWMQRREDDDLDNSQYNGFWNNRISPAIGKKKIYTITEADLQGILTKAYKDGLAKKTLQNIRGCLSGFMKYCRSRKCTTLFPESLTVNKKAPTSHKRALEPDDIATLFSQSNSIRRGVEGRDWFINMYRFAVATGLRPGELCGLKKSDVDGNILHVSRSFNKKNEFTTGKNENANRRFALNDIAISVYNDQIEFLKTKIFRTEYLFPKTNGQPCSIHAFERNWKKYCDMNGISYVTPYELRHTYVSLMKDMPEELLKLQVGHSKAMRTRETYSHEQKGDSERAAELSSKALEKVLKRKGKTADAE